MPPPMVVCSICGCNVMKAQTYHVGDGKRACKTHEGVVERKSELEQQIVLNKEAEKRAKARNDEKRAPYVAGKNRCWACQREAITEREMWFKILVAGQRMEVKNIKMHPFMAEYPEQLRRELNLDPGKKLLVTSLFPVEGNEKLVNKFPPQVRQLGQLAGYVSVCQDCAHNVGLQFKPPEVSFDQIAAMAALMEVVVTPVLREIAKDELQGEAEKN